uniref:C-type lectin domain-containing protein n=1 Tax=Takifugu rubripes TaxID=31033 RepID=A0A674P9M7_TAKRU
MDGRRNLLLQLLSFAALLLFGESFMFFNRERWSVYICTCQCQAGWRQYEDRCYLFSNDTKTWLEGEMRTHLETSIGKLFFLIILMSFFFQLWLRTQIGADIFWIGLNDQVVEGTWEWSDGTTYIEYLFWMQGQPDDWGGAEDCVQVVGYSNGVSASSMSFLLFCCFYQKCSKISCQVQAGNTQFAWSDAQSSPHTNWAANEPTV